MPCKYLVYIPQTARNNQATEQDSNIISSTRRKNTPVAVNSMEGWEKMKRALCSELISEEVLEYSYRITAVAALCVLLHSQPMLHAAGATHTAIGQQNL